MQYREQTIGMMSEVAPSVRKRVSEVITKALRLAENYRGRGDAFAFDLYPELDEKINELLISLSDGLLKDAEKRARNVLDLFDMVLDEETIIHDAEEGEKGIVWALDMHCSNLKKVIAAWIAVGFANGWDTGKILNNCLVYMSNPDASLYWREAVRTKVVDPNEVQFGRGYQRNVIDAVTVTEQGMIYRSFLIASQWVGELDGATHYIIHRGSAFDCPLCDDRCGVPIPIDVPYVPTHIRCVCQLEFVTLDEEE